MRRKRDRSSSRDGFPSIMSSYSHEWLDYDRSWKVISRLVEVAAKKELEKAKRKNDKKAYGRWFESTVDEVSIQSEGIGEWIRRKCWESEGNRKGCHWKTSSYSGWVIDWLITVINHLQILYDPNRLHYVVIYRSPNSVQYPSLVSHYDSHSEFPVVVRFSTRRWSSEEIGKNERNTRMRCSFSSRIYPIK